MGQVDLERDRELEKWMAVVEIKIKSYPEDAENLVNIWDKHVANMKYNSWTGEFITFTNRTPRNQRSNSRRIGGFPAELVSHLRDDTELVKMSVENFIYLMVKMGVEIEAKEVLGDE